MVNDNVMRGGCVMRKKILTTLLGSTLLSVPAIAMDAPVETSHTRKHLPADADITREGHLNGNVLEKSINDLNEGKKGVCFIPINFSHNEKNFLEQLKVKIPTNTIGKEMNLSGCMLFTEKEKLSETSAFNKVKSSLKSFFADYTNASELEKPDGIINGPDFLANVLLEYSEKLIDKANAAQKDEKKNNFLFISIKTFKENDAFLNFFRWHYDGFGNVRPGAADLNFAGAFTGAPTVFAETADENRNVIVSRVLEAAGSGSPSAEELIEKLTLMRDTHEQHTPEYKNLDKEILNVRILESSNDSNKNKIFHSLWYRMNLQSLEKEKLISGIVQPKSHEVALFTMRGVKPALHSEPHVAVPRIFFGLRVYEDMRGIESPVSLNISDLSDPRKY